MNRRRTGSGVTASEPVIGSRPVACSDSCNASRTRPAGATHPRGPCPPRCTRPPARPSRRPPDHRPRTRASPRYRLVVLEAKSAGAGRASDGLLRRPSAASCGTQSLPAPIRGIGQRGPVAAITVRMARVARLDLPFDHAIPIVDRATCVDDPTLRRRLAESAHRVAVVFGRGVWRRGAAQACGIHEASHLWGWPTPAGCGDDRRSGDRERGMYSVLVCIVYGPPFATPVEESSVAE